jgi:hypothetical protein
MSAPSLQPLFPNPTVLPEKNNVKTLNTVMTPRGKIPLGKEYNKGYTDTSKQFKHGAKMSETVIPSSARSPKPATNMRFVNSRQGGSSEHGMTKNASMKHENPQFFKRQADRKNADAFGMQKTKAELNTQRHKEIHENRMKSDPEYKNQEMKQMNEKKAAQAYEHRNSPANLRRHEQETLRMKAMKK